MIFNVSCKAVPSTGNINVLSLNTRSLRNKVGDIISILKDFKTDIAFIQETWLKSTDGAIYAQIKEHNFKVHTFRKPRKSDLGGGVAAIYKSSLKVTKARSRTNYKSFEHLECLLHTQNGLVRFINIYRPDYSSKHRFTVNAFLEEFTDYVQDVTTLPGHPVFVGDYNLHVEDDTDGGARKFLDILNNYGYKQMVNQATHRLNGTLDLIFTTDPSKIKNVDVYTRLTTSDHDPIIFSYQCKPIYEASHKFIYYRQWKNLDLTKFKENIKQIFPSTFTAPETLDEVVDMYNSTLIKLLDEQCPVIKRKIRNRSGIQKGWYNIDPNLKTLKQNKRRAHRLYQKKRDDVSLKKYQDELKVFNDARNKARNYCNKEKINRAKGDLKSTFKIVNTLTSEDSSPILPAHTCKKHLANDFAKFFNSKIENIRDDLVQSNANSHSADFHPSVCLSNFEEFKSLAVEDVVKLVMSMKSKNNPDDPIPTWLVKECIHELSFILTVMVNKSLQGAYFPDSLKHASVRPLVKDANGDVENKKNFRPVSNLSFLSKLLEKAALQQINEHVNSEGFHSIYQSGYRPNHSCETSVFKLTYDIQEAINNKEMVAALFLDMSAAFDTVDHDVLLSRLSRDFGFKGQALAWLSSYLTNRTFSVVIGNERSDTFLLLYGVPQGSLLGPLLFILYTKELSTIAMKHGLKIQIYADDTTLYINFLPLIERNDAFATIKNCLDEIKLFLTQSYLKLNASKTMTTFFGSKYHTSIYKDLSIDYHGDILDKEPSFKETLGVCLIPT